MIISLSDSQIFKSFSKAVGAHCKKHGIRISGPSLGRPPKDEKLRKEQKDIQRQDEAIRNQVEGCFGVAKRRYKLDRIFTKIKASSETLIALIFMVMNLDKALAFLSLLGQYYTQLFVHIFNLISLISQGEHLKRRVIQ